MTTPHLTDEQLDAPGEAPHLAECAECRAKVARAAARQKLMKGVRPYTLADVAFSRVEARLMEHARENAPGPRWSFGRILAIGALAAVAAMFAVTTVRPLLSPPPVVVAAAFEPLTVVLASGQVSVKAGDVLGRDAVVDAVNGRVMLATADGTALRLSGGAKVVLGGATETVKLEAGVLSVIATGRGPWVVQAGHQWLRIADAAFDVAPDSLTLYRGSVLLADNASFENARQVNAAVNLKLPSGQPSSVIAPPRAVPALAAPPWGRLELKLDATEVELDGLPYGPSPLSLMMGLGKHKVRAKVGEQWREGEIEATAGGPGLIELPERQAVVPVMPPEPAVEADPEAIAKSVKAQLPKLRVCHEKWLKVNESARGRVLMTLTVSPKGRVVRAQFAADEGVPEAVNECLGRAVRTMTLPKSSEEVELEIPVLLGQQ